MSNPNADEIRQISPGFWPSKILLSGVEMEGGFDHTGADRIGWMKGAGFRLTGVEHLVGPDSKVGI